MNKYKLNIVVLLLGFCLHGQASDGSLDVKISNEIDFVEVSVL